MCIFNFLELTTTNPWCWADWTQTLWCHPRIREKTPNCLGGAHNWYLRWEWGLMIRAALPAAPANASRYALDYLRRKLLTMILPTPWRTTNFHHKRIQTATWAKTPVFKSLTISPTKSLESASSTQSRSSLPCPLPLAATDRKKNSLTSISCIVGVKPSKMSWLRR